MAQHEYGMIMNSFDNVEQSRFVYGGQHDYFFPEELISPSESNFFEENANYIMRPETDDSDDPLYYSIGLFMNGVGNHDDYTTDHHQMGIYYNTELSHDESSNNTTITTSTGSHYSIGESLFVHNPPVAVAAGEADIYNDGSFCNMAMMQYNDDDQAAILSLNSYNLLMNYGIGDTKQFGSSISTANLMATDDDNSKSEGPYIIDNIHPKCSVEESSSCTKSKKRGRGSESEVSRRKVRKNVKYSKGKINTKIAADEINVEIAKDNDTNATETMVLETSDQDEIGVNEGQEKPTINKTEKVKGTISRTGSSMEAQSIYAKKRREKINERLRILQGLVPNGKKLDMSTMLEEAVHYVKFLQHQIKMLSSDDLWMYAPIVHNGMGTSTTSPSL